MKMNDEVVDEEGDYVHSIISFELDEGQKGKLLSAFQSLYEPSNQEGSKNFIYEMTGLAPILEEKLASNSDLDSCMKWLFEQHGFVESESTTFSKN